MGRLSPDQFEAPPPLARPGRRACTSARPLHRREAIWTPVASWGAPLLRLRAAHYHAVAEERRCASQQKLRADVADGSNWKVTAARWRGRFTFNSGHIWGVLPRPLSANSRHCLDFTRSPSWWARQP